MAKAFGIVVPKNASAEIAAALQAVERFILDSHKRPVEVPQYLVADLPNAADWPHHVIGVPDESGGDTLAKSNGTNWIRVSDGAVVS